MTRTILLAALLGLAGCGGKPATKSPTEPSDQSTAPVPRARCMPPATQSTAATAGRTEIEVRRDAACEAVGPCLTACAIEDARDTMSREDFAALELEKTAPRHTEEFLTACKQQDLSSRQVRVYEVCVTSELECGDLLGCLDHLNDKP